MNADRLWGGRFETLPSPEVISFLSGRDVRGISPCDERLIPYDLWGSRAHTVMLCRQGILSPRDGRAILKGLRDIESLHRRGRFPLDPSKEDVHTQIERFLIRHTGMEHGGKIHTGRSRNDQIALDMRLYLRDEALQLVNELLAVNQTLLTRAKTHAKTLMPGFTHYQPATVTTFGHLLLSFAEGLERDIRRFVHWFDLFNKNPLGSAAGYGTSFRLDRRLTSKLLGFDGPEENVTDPITQRWEPELELAYGVAVAMNHFSTLAQTLIVLSTSQFNLVRLDDRHCSGSSVMPQKRNPDILEVVKAKAAFAHGMVVSLLSVGKGLFVGYNRDTQWTKYWIMDLLDESRPVLSIMREVLRWLRVNDVSMRAEARKGFLGATFLMEWLARVHGIPLRKAKEVVERAVRLSEREGRETLSFEAVEKALRDLKIQVPLRSRDVEKIQQPEAMWTQFWSIGTPSRKRLRETLASLDQRLRYLRDWAIRKKKAMEAAKKVLVEMEKRIRS